MSKKTRLENTIHNSIIGIVSQLVNVALGLVVRTVFIYSLSSDYLGVNGLFSNILTVLSLAEMGVGAAILFNIYKPLVEGDERQIARLLNLYRNAYRCIGGAVAVIGLSLTPFLHLIIREKTDIPHITCIYVLYLTNTVVSYFYSYKRSLLIADQRERVIKFFNVLTYFVRAFFQILILVVWHNFVAYLFIQIVCTLLENIMISGYVDKQYPYIRKYKAESLTKKEKSTIFDNIKATFIYRFGSVILDGTDNIIITAVNGVVSVGLFSNYTLLTGSVQSFLNIINNSVIGSIGNYIASEKSEKHERLLLNATFMNFVLHGVVFVGSVAILNSFVNVWAGADYLLASSIVVIHCLNLYICGTLSTVWTFRSTMGLFTYGKWRPLVTAILNLVVSIWLGNEMGLVGVLLGTTFSRVVTNVWYDPYIIYKYGLKSRPVKYYIRWTLYLIVTLVNVVIILYLQQVLNLVGILAIIVYGFAAVLLFGLSVFAIFNKTEEYAYALKTIKRYKKR